MCKIFGKKTENEVFMEANEEAIVAETRNPQENRDSKPIGSWVWGRRSLESSSEEEAMCTVFDHGREKEGIKEAIEEAIVAEPKKPQEREDGVNVNHREGKPSEEEGREVMNNEFDTEERNDFIILILNIFF